MKTTPKRNTSIVGNCIFMVFGILVALEAIVLIIYAFSTDSFELRFSHYFQVVLGIALTVYDGYRIRQKLAIRKATSEA